MRRFLGLAVGLAFPLALSSGAAAQGFGVYEHNTCAMGRAGTAVASPCADGSAIFFNPAGLVGLSGIHFSGGVTVVAAGGGFTDDVFRRRTDLDNKAIPVPNAYVTYGINDRFTAGIGMYVPYGLETCWAVTQQPGVDAPCATTSTDQFLGRFLGYNSKLQSIYIQPTVGYQLSDRVAVGGGVAYVLGEVKLRQRLDLSTQRVPGQTFTFASLGILEGTDFADALLEADGTGLAWNAGLTVKVSDQLTVGAHYLSRAKIDYEGNATFTQINTGIILPPGNPINPATPVPLDLTLAPSFASGGLLADSTATTEITMPSQAVVGLAWKFNDQWTFMADYQHVVWSYFRTVRLDFTNAATPDLTLVENYRDTHGVRMGTEYRRNDKLTLRAGYLYHTAAAPSQTVTPLLPEGSRNEWTVGASFQLTPKLRGDLGYQYILQNDRRGRVHDVTVGNTGLYEFSAHLFGAGFAITF